MLPEVAEPHLKAVLKKPRGNTERPRLILQHRSIAVGNANDAGEVACNKPEAQAKGIEQYAF